MAEHDDDCEQEINIRFWRKPPATISLAWRMARQVRIDLWRKEKRHRHADLAALERVAADSEPPQGDALVDALYRRDFHRTRWLLNYYERCRHSVKDRSTAFRYRKELRALV